MRASFTNITWHERGRLELDATVGEVSDRIWVDLPEGTSKPHDDLIGTFLATLAGPGLERTTMELDLSASAVEAIQTFCGDLDSGRHPYDRSSGPRTSGAVSFSGGFDSLAALALLPKSPHLISMDFGGWFQRETDFFVEFNPKVVSTNFRMAGFGRRSWMFMLGGTILLSDELSIGPVTTGSILESSPWHYRKLIDNKFRTPDLLHSVGLSQVNTTAGITEVATTLLTMQNFPEQVSRSLASLAAPGSGKLLRKQMLVSSLQTEGKAQLPTTPRLDLPSSAPLQYGQSLTDDMLIPYMLKHSGENAANALMNDIPTELVKLAKDLQLDFYERFHTGMYVGLPSDVYQHVTRRLIDAGILPFTERDWQEYRDVISIISLTHDLPL